VDRLSRLIDDLLDVSQMTSGQLKVIPAQVDLVTLIRDTTDRLRPAAIAALCELQVELPEEVPASVDAGRIEQVLINLLSNAMKYGREGLIRVTLSHVGPQVHISVEDHGIGIEEKDFERIFERFERAAPFGRYPGLGIGLFVAREIAQAHGGSIEVESRSGEGTKFTLRLPIAGGLT
jgi:signal transduction histidine kinase